MASHPPGPRGPLEIGGQFLKFEIRELLGRGGHAWVYHGYDPFLDRHVAIKVIPNPAEPGRDLRQRAQMEARVLCKLQHPNVVHVIDAGATQESGVYIVMEILHGRTLRDVIHDFKRLSESEMLMLGVQIADGVQAAHEQNAIHRDLKPENVFLLKDNVLKVLDFGIAKFLGYGAKTTQRDVIHGTVLYMSPEHLQGFGVTVRSDIYALGSMLYEACAGIPPCMIGIQDPTGTALAWSQVNRMPPPLDEFTGTVPRFIARTIQRMIAKDPSDRFASMTEAGQHLRGNFQRFAEETRGAIPAPRELWHAVEPTSATRMSLATTQFHELQSSSAFKFAGGSDTAPVSKAPFSTVSPSSVPMQSDAPRTGSLAATLLSPPEAPSVPQVSGAAPHAQTLLAAPESVALFSSGSVPPLGPTPSSGTVLPATRPPRTAIWGVVAAAVAVGVGAGVISGFVGTSHSASSAPSASADDKITVLSASKPTIAPAVPVSVAAQAQPSPSSSTVSNAESPVTQAKPVSPSAARATNRARGQGSGGTANSMPSSGLWDMSDLDQAKPAPPPKKAKPVAKPIFEADDI